nr:ribonuclease H-like domain-containing protein [Tanacetum cinerariifolium]
MRPFGCPVSIINILDPLGKFDGKAEEGFLVGYSVNSKAFRQGPNWLFDIDSLANSMNYQPVTARNQANKNAGHKEVNGDTVNTASADNTTSEVNTASASRTFNPPHDPLMPELEDTAAIQTTGIFGNAYDEDDLD